MFFVQFDGLYSMKKFCSTFVDLGVALTADSFKKSLKNRPKSWSDQMAGGFFVLRYQDLIFDPDGAQGMYSILPRPFVDIWKSHGKIEIPTLLKLAILGYF